MKIQNVSLMKYDFEIWKNSIILLNNFKWIYWENEGILLKIPIFLAILRKQNLLLFIFLRLKWINEFTNENIRKGKITS